MSLSLLPSYTPSASYSSSSVPSRDIKANLTIVCSSAYKIILLGYSIFCLGREFYLAGHGLKVIAFNMIRSLPPRRLKSQDVNTQKAWHSAMNHKMGYILTHILDGAMEMLSGLSGIFVNLHYLKVLNLGRAAKPLAAFQLLTYIASACISFIRCIWLIFETQNGRGLTKDMGSDQKTQIIIAASLGIIAYALGALAAGLCLLSVSPWIVFPIGIASGVVISTQVIYVYYQQLKNLLPCLNAQSIAQKNALWLLGKV